MSIKQIFQKFFIKSFLYSPGENDNNLFVQYFPKKYKKFRFKVNDIINSKSNYHRGLISNHIANLRINNVPIEKFIRKKSKRVIVNNSGTISKYIPGSISQELIFNTFVKS